MFTSIVFTYSISSGNRIIGEFNHITDDMRKLHIICIRNKTILITVVLITVFVAVMLLFSLLVNSSQNFVHSYTKIIVIDPGHGGIDGGAFEGGMLEKDINLDIAKRVKALLEDKDYQAILTRQTDRSLDNLIDGGGSRHLRDLKARAQIINNSNAQLFLSIHGNCHIKNLSADGSFVLYSEKTARSKTLAYCVQRTLNDIRINGEKRTVHDPMNTSNFYLLNYAQIPGIIIETAFISNQKERELLSQDSFKEDIAKAISSGVESYFAELRMVNGTRKDPKAK